MSIKVIAGSWRKSFFAAGGGFARSLISSYIFVIILGIIAGGGVGVFSSISHVGEDISLYAQEYLLPDGFGECLFSAGRFFFLAALFSTSYLGVILLPSLVLVRGYILSYAAAALFSAFSFKGLLCALLIYGVPAFISVPCFLIACCGCFESSRCLFMQKFHSLPSIKSMGHVWPLLLALFAIAFESIYSSCLLPDLLARFF